MQEKVEEKDSVLRSIEGRSYWHTVEKREIYVNNVITDGRKVWISTHNSYYDSEEWQNLRFDGTIEEYDWQKQEGLKQ